LEKTNSTRQSIVDNVLKKAGKILIEKDKVIIIEGDYHEGVIGLASGKITEKLFRPSIVISKRESISKASARSIEGFDIIRAIKETKLIIEGGGHPMAAGFSIDTNKIEEFKLKINEIANKSIPNSLLEKKLNIDLEIDFKHITYSLLDLLENFEPLGYKNTQPVFLTKNIIVKDLKKMGSKGNHLKLILKSNNEEFETVLFNSENFEQLKKGDILNIVYSLERNVWNGISKIQLFLKDFSLVNC
jgi:single-stranded-DNA-specific exonuclease